jgi:hypothetical protein
MKNSKPEATGPETALGSRSNTCASDETTDRIKSMIRDMPQIDPPPGLLRSVMESVEAKRLPLWVRAYRWARLPRTVTFNLLHLAPAMAACALLVFLALPAHEKQNGNAVLSQASGLIPVRFALDKPDAHSVQVVGSFNGWVPQPCLLDKDNGSTRWTLTLQLQPGRYEYAFLVDGKSMPHPDAEFNQDDGFGNKNTVLALGNEDDV